jgi:hypothetical protein
MVAVFLHVWTDILALIIIIGIGQIVRLSQEIRITCRTWLGVAVAATVCAWPPALSTRATLRAHLVAFHMALLAYETILLVSHDA